MNTKRWVQYKNDPNGEKWEVIDELPVQWIVNQGAGIPRSILPKLDYLICDPPEIWEDVTGECEIVVASRSIPENFVDGIAYSDGALILEPTFHLKNKGLLPRKIQLYKTLVSGCHAAETCWAFIIERKKT